MCLLHVCCAVQSAAVAEQLEATQAQLASVSSELHNVQQLLQEQRFEYAQALVAVTAARQASAGHSQHEQVRELQLTEQRLGAELADARHQLTELLQQLEAERATTGQLHTQVTKLRSEFADMCAAVEAERTRAAALQAERSRLEAALQEASDAAASAEADAAAARSEAKASAQQAHRAAAEAEGTKAKLSDVKAHTRQLDHQLIVAVEVVAQQQAALQQRTEQVGQLQQEVAVTRKCLLG